MSDIGTALSAWREVGHLAEYTGLSIGMLAGCVALFLYVPVVRKLAVIGAIAAVALGLGLVHGESIGHRDGKAEVQAQWDDARAAAIKADEERDAMAEQNLEAKYGPEQAALGKRLADSEARADEYARKNRTLTNGGAAKPGAAPAGGAKAVPQAARACELGDAADRVPIRPKAR
jgi:hypothetical protein